MDLSQPVSDIVRARSSRRKYQPRAIDPELKTKMDSCLESIGLGPFESATRFELITAQQGDAAALKGLGTYGFIRNPAGFLVGTVDEGAEKGLEDFGYVMEKAILYATDIGLGTCWLGGTFKRSEFAVRMGVQGNETVPAVASIGHATEQRGKVERIVRWGAKAKTRKPADWLFFGGRFETPLDMASCGRYSHVLEMVRIGPSASNKQPWRFVFDADKKAFHLFLKRTPKYEKNIERFKLADLQRVDMGIAMAHFEMAAVEEGMSGRWTLAEPDLALPEKTEYVCTWVEGDAP